MAKNDGGPAFPVLRVFEGYDSDRERDVVMSDVTGGMSLREYFAGQALAGLCARLSSDDFLELRDGIRAGGHEARVAYALADAMLKAGEAA